MMNKALMLLVVACGGLTLCYRLLPPVQQAQLRAYVQQLQGAEPAGLPAILPAATAGEPRYKLQIPDAPVSRRASPGQVSAAEAYINKREYTDHLLVASAYVQRLQDVQVQGEGRVVRILPDDTQGSKHQRFILRTPEDVSVLIAHNIDLAPRLANLQQGDQVAFYGEYVWNEKGGTVHWTHRDPRGKHLHGWLKHQGVTYQ